MGKRTLVIIDGSNLYFKLKDLQVKNLIDFNYDGLIKSLADKNANLKIRYYIGAIRTDGSKKSLKMFKEQRRLLANLKKQKIVYSLGYLLKSDGKYHEKGVDVQMVVDMLRGAYRKEFDQVILVSSDSDLVIYIGFKHRPSYALLKTCKRSILLDKKDVKEF